ncbi:ATP-binding protein [Commensalibacter melissae]|uniref:ATP-binding protein n=1 Tax=Commensalibacter melissae TaxID=2070537 RepID=UPI0012D87802|nr:ATP-binding protein [Commensalibacter melissae]MUH05371.1 hypothetical protein [Commensalibacter melissae]
MADELTLTFDPNTIKHLGVSLYSQLASVLAELISNSWDADADNITIEFIDNMYGKQIIYEDDGYGMSLNEMNDKYLVIGRNRREQEPLSPRGRKPIGKKGLGKLSVFGICNIVIVESNKNNLLNRFRMKLQDILSSNDGTYNPAIEKCKEASKNKSYTKIILQDIRRKSEFKVDNIANSLAKKFTIFDKLKVTLIDKENDKQIQINNAMKFANIESEFEWDFPNNDLTSDYYYNKKDCIVGKIITSYTPIKSPEMRGIYLVSRGKIVNEAEFYGARDNDQFHSYVTGYLSIDFIDEEDEDLISTDRHSLNWENDTTKKLKEYLQEIIKVIAKDWRVKRAKKKKEELVAEHIDVDGFLDKLPNYQKELANKILEPILSASNIDHMMARNVVKNVIAKFNHEDYKKYAEAITELDMSSESKAAMLSNLTDWGIIENTQYSALAFSRIEIINKFEEYVNSYTKEIPILHKFLKKFPWLIDPRILELRDEVRYTDILKKAFPEDKLEEKNRRIDFLCTNFLGGVIYIIEIKHSTYEVDKKAIEQAYDYQSFIKSKYCTEESFNAVICYVIGGSVKSDYATQSKMKSYRYTNEVFVKTYSELLEQSKQYHKEFLDMYHSN